MFTEALFTIAKVWKQPENQSTDKWIKMQYMYRMGYYSATKKNGKCHLQQHGWTYRVLHLVK